VNSSIRALENTPTTGGGDIVKLLTNDGIVFSTMSIVTTCHAFLKPVPGNWNRVVGHSSPQAKEIKTRQINNVPSLFFP